MRKKFVWKYLVIGIVVINVCYIFVSQQIKMHKIQTQIDARNAEANQRKIQNQKLQDQVKMAKSDEYSEELAREKLGLIKEGEIPVVNSSTNK
jgi:cell division protein FtsB